MCALHRMPFQFSAAISLQHFNYSFPFVSIPTYLLLLSRFIHLNFPSTSIFSVLKKMRITFSSHTHHISVLLITLKKKILHSHPLLPLVLSWYSSSLWLTQTPIPDLVLNPSPCQTPTSPLSQVQSPCHPSSTWPWAQVHHHTSHPAWTFVFSWWQCCGIHPCWRRKASLWVWVKGNEIILCMPYRAQINGIRYGSDKVAIFLHCNKENILKHTISIKS